jgi:integrase
LVLSENYLVINIFRPLPAGTWDISDPVSGKTALLSFLEEYTKNYKSPSIIAACVKHVKEFRSGNILLAQITPKWVENFQSYMLGKDGISQSTAAYYSGILRCALRKAAKNNMILKNPAEGVKRIPATETELVYLNSDELKRLAAVTVADPYGAEVRRAFLFACFMGLRAVDLETLTWGRIETSPMQIIKSQIKTKTPVYIPLNKTAQELIADGKEHKSEEKIFNLGTHIRRTSYTYLQSMDKRSANCKAGGLAYGSAHIRDTDTGKRRGHIHGCQTAWPQQYFPSRQIRESHGQAAKGRGERFA